MIVADDGPRWDDLYFMPNLQALLAESTRFDRHYGDDNTCAPTRSSIMTGYYTHNHKITPTNITTKDWQAYAMEGEMTAGFGDPFADPWTGPWLKLLGDRHASDNAKHTSGGVFNWAKRLDAVVGLSGKLNNGHGYPTTRVDAYGVTQDYTTYDADGIPLGPRMVPPDMDFFYTTVGDDSCFPFSTANWNGGIQDSYNGWICTKGEHDKSNILTNEFAIGKMIYQTYEKLITSISSDLTTSTINFAVDHGLRPGGKFIIQGNSSSFFNKVASVGSPAPEWECVDVLGPTVATFLHGNGTPPTPGTGGSAFVKDYYETHRIMDQAEAFLARRKKSEKFFLYIAFNGPHDQQSSNVEVEKKYQGVVDPNDFTRWGGVAGAINPGITATVTTPMRNNWAQRQEMLHSIDDRIGTLRAAIDSNPALGKRVRIIFVSDQGCHYGEKLLVQNNGGEYFAKNTAWEPCKNSCMAYGPEFPPGLTTTMLTHQADIPMTIIDILGETDPDQYGRDGVSMIDVLRPDFAWPNRAIAMYHNPSDLGATKGALIDAEGYKWVQSNPAWGNDPGFDQLYNINSDPHELTSLHATEAARMATMSARYDAIRLARGVGTRTP